VNAWGSGTYQAGVYTRGGRRRLTQISQLSQVTWSRVADDASKASAVIPRAAQTATCQSVLAGLDGWGYELVLWRDGERFWEGPLQTVLHTRTAVTLGAVDVSGWLDHRTVHQRYRRDTGTDDLSVLVTLLLADALGPDDPNVLGWADVRRIGRTSTWLVNADTVMAGATLRDWASQQGLNFTAVGRRIVVFPEATPLGVGPLLTDDSFLGDALSVLVDGTQTTSRAMVVSQQPPQDATTGQFTTTNEPTQQKIGDAGTTDPFYGLLETIIQDNSQVPPGPTAAQITSAARVAADNPTPTILGVASGSALSPLAPITLAQLVPGVVVPVRSTATLRQVQQTMQIQSVTGTWQSATTGTGAASTPKEVVTAQLVTWGGVDPT
jgi:hypothetical protein